MLTSAYAREASGPFVLCDATSVRAISFHLTLVVGVIDAAALNAGVRIGIATVELSEQAAATVVVRSTTVRQRILVDTMDSRNLE
jgi:hypothetical protein